MSPLLVFITETGCAIYDVGAEVEVSAIKAKQQSMRDRNSRSFRDKCRKLDISPATTYRLQSTVNQLLRYFGKLTVCVMYNKDTFFSDASIFCVFSLQTIVNFWYRHNDRQNMHEVYRLRTFPNLFISRSSRMWHRKIYSAGV